MEIDDDGWDVKEVLGQGEYGEVEHVVNLNGHHYARKSIQTANIISRTDASNDAFLYFFSILQSLDHPNIIKCFGRKIEESVYRIYLEYVEGGDLHSKLTYDIGVEPVERAHTFFCQLISGVQYLHCNAIAHRDIKPANLLINNMDELKIADFGFATSFRSSGVDCKSNSRCGTEPFTAPEVSLAPAQDYSPAPADIWSCGVVLILLLSGQHPWKSASASFNDPLYKEWKEKSIDKEQKPWTNVGEEAFSLLRSSMLNYKPDERATIQEIVEHTWFTRDYSGQSDGGPAAKRLKRDPM